MDLLARFVGIWMVFVICIAVGVEGANFNETCTTNGDCTETNAVKCDSGSKKCICSDGFFRKTTAKECAAHKDYGEQCTGSGVGNCKKASDMVCDTTCKCSPTTFRKTTPAECATKIDFKSTCVKAEAATDQCVASTECKTDGSGNNKCLCKATHYASSSTCEPRKKPSESCAVNQCVPNANCTSGTNICECWPDYTATPGISPTMCSGVYKVIVLPCMYMVTVLVSMMLIVK